MSIVLRESFNGHPINFLEYQGDLYAQALAIAKAFDYSSPAHAVRNLINRNPEAFKGCIINVAPTHPNFTISDAATVAVTVSNANTVFLNAEGIALFTQLSQARNSAQFKKWLAQTVHQNSVQTVQSKQIAIKDPFVILEQVNQQVALSLQIMRDQSQQLYNQDQQLHKQDQRLNYQDIKIEQLERLTRSTYIDDTQAYHIKRRVDQLAYCIAENDGITKPNQIIFTSIWTKFHEIFKISKWRQLPKARYYDAIGLLDEHIRNEGFVPPKEC